MSENNTGNNTENKRDTNPDAQLDKAVSDALVTDAQEANTSAVATSHQPSQRLQQQLLKLSSNLNWLAKADSKPISTLLPEAHNKLDQITAGHSAPTSSTASRPQNCPPRGST